ncbi:tyrosine-specific transport protein [Nicoletella semolina]|uniref:Aromatic amino acid permease n=1 Tax=Nicoletella semolina TaxID=271160 RepID=A0A4R2NB22_9PAST|nr:aromatic amino acid transport family protein [Nicoletella semolina]MDH2924050.1 tyrosine transporter [Nicoletella semolina]TCP18185.1 tyrosine-specific transport protein [Nicoletella semolina]
MKNKTFGSALIVAGTTIGAGMLAMPITSAEMGFSYTLILLFALWALLSYSALLFVEVYQKAESKDAGAATLAEQHFGLFGRISVTVVSIVFMYALLTAYALGGGNLLMPLFAFLGENAESFSIVLFVVVFAIAVTIGVNAVDVFTRVLFIIKLAAFGFVLFMMLPNVTLDNLGAMPLHYLLIISASPVFFTSFGFHVVIPSINNYLEGDIKRLRIAILTGSAIPLVAYILWQMATHGVFSQLQFVEIIRHNPTLNGLVEATFSATGSELISHIVRLFSALAIITSFLGVALALLDCLDDLFKRINSNLNRFSLSLLTFLPVLFFALFFRNFLGVLTYAGQMFTFYGLLLPVGMVWVLRRKFPNLPYQVIGGNFGLLLTLVSGILILIAPVLVDFGILPKVVG